MLERRGIAEQPAHADQWCPIDEDVGGPGEKLPHPCVVMVEIHAVQIVMSDDAAPASGDLLPHGGEQPLPGNRVDINPQNAIGRKASRFGCGAGPGGCAASPGSEDITYSWGTRSASAGIASTGAGIPAAVPEGTPTRTR